MLTIFMNTNIKKIFENTSKTLGISYAAKDFFLKLRLEIMVTPSPTSGSGTLIVSNHINPLDLFVVMSIAPKNSYFITLRVNALGETFRKVTLPIYISQSLYKRKRLRLAGLFWSYKEGWLHRKKVKQLNIETIKKAAVLLSQGNNVIIFPQGMGIDPHRDWKNGIGYLCSQVTNNKVNVQFVNIKGFSPTDILRIISPKLNKIFFTKKVIKATISKPLKLSTFTKNNTPKEITQKLHSYYEKSYTHSK